MTDTYQTLMTGRLFCDYYIEPNIGVDDGRGEATENE